MTARRQEEHKEQKEELIWRKIKDKQRNKESDQISTPNST